MDVEGKMINVEELKQFIDIIFNSKSISNYEKELKYFDEQYQYIKLFEQHYNILQQHISNKGNSIKQFPIITKSYRQLY